MKSIHIELVHDSQVWCYDGIGPEGVGEWLLNLIPSLGPEFAAMTGTATIRVRDVG